MNEREYILNQLSQECVEVCKEISKALAFGLYDFNPNESPSISNRDRIESKLNYNGTNYVSSHNGKLLILFD